MYTSYNYKTKKALIEDVKKLQAIKAAKFVLEERLRVFQPNSDITGARAPQNGTVFLEGPHYPKPHQWYAEAEVVNQVVVKVK
jgi:hypothetical protein